MPADEQAWRDKRDGMVSVDCPKCRAVIRLRQETMERGVVIINCPACGFSFDYERPS